MFGRVLTTPLNILMHTINQNICYSVPLFQDGREVYWEACQTSKMESFAKTVTDPRPLTIFAKCSNLDVWQGSQYAFVELN